MVRPVDLQDNLSKAPLASRAQQVQQDNPEMAQRQSAQELAQQHIEDRARTLPADEGKEAEMHPDQGQGNLSQRRRRRQNKKEEEKQVEPTETNKSDDSSAIDLIA
tara:strand:- start:305 stop:622 length:318 start_codon:yes stop_codon:yes gene_type:complete